MKSPVTFLLLVFLPVLLFAQPQPPQGLVLDDQAAPDPFWDGTVTLSWIPPIADGDLYANDFNDGDVSGWDVENMTHMWGVEDGRLELSILSIYTQEYFYARYLAEEFHTYVYEFDFGYHAPVGSVDDISVIKSLTAINEDNFSNCMTLDMGLGGGSDPEFEPFVTLYRVGQSRDFQFTAPVDITPGPEQAHHMTMVVYRNWCAVYVDGEFAAMTHDEDGAPRLFNGHVGMGARWISNSEDTVWFDNMKVSSINPNDTILEYRLYDNGEFVTALDPDELFVTYQVSEHGWHALTMTAVTNEGESDQSDPCSVFYDDPDNCAILIEGFDDGLPDSWTIDTHPTASSTWTWLENYSWMPRAPCMAFSAYSEGDHTPYSDLISPSFSLVNPDNPAMVPALIFTTLDGYTAGSSVGISVAGSEFRTLDGWNRDGGPHPDTLSLAAYMNQDDVRIRFRVKNPDLSSVWMIDDVYVKFFLETNVGEDDDSAARPGSFEITSLAPNPFNASTTIRVQLPAPGDLSVKVYNTLGQQVGTLHDGPHHAGEHAFSLDGSNLASGVYVVHAEYSGQSIARKIVLMK